MLTRPRLLIVAFVVQVLCATVFVLDILVSVLGLRLQPIDWRMRELIELGAAAGLILGVILGAVILRAVHRRSNRLEQQLQAASGAFADLMEERFFEWGLTPAERDVALFSIKGLSTSEIAAMRDTSEGTVKAQTNAIYRKAGVSGRPQLLGLFIDDLMDDSLLTKGGIEPEPQNGTA